MLRQSSLKTADNHLKQSGLKTKKDYAERVNES